MARIVRAITRDGEARAIVIDSTDICERAREIHNTAPTATAALGRTLTAASLMGSLLGEETDLLTLRFKGDGPGGTLVATSDWKGNVRGFIKNPACDLPLREDGKLNVGGCVGRGEFYVLRDCGGTEPYCGVAEIQSGEIGEDIAYYYATSEQVPTVCALGVLVDTDITVKRAGGALVQLLPFASEETAARLEENAAKMRHVTEILNGGRVEDIIAEMLSGFEYDIFDSFECSYKCACSREKTDSALVSLGASELSDMIAEGRETVLTCGFCDAVYKYSVADLKNLLKKAQKKEENR